MYSEDIEWEQRGKTLARHTPSGRMGHVSLGFLEQDSTVEAANLLARRSTRLKLSEKNGNDNRLRLPAEDMEVFPYPRRKPGASQRSLLLLLFPE